MIVVCREYPYLNARKGIKNYVVAHNPDNRDLWMLNLRGRFNPELEYYVSRLDENPEITEEEILILFTKKACRKPPYFVKV